jgi:hypothetical protein
MDQTVEMKRDISMNLKFIKVMKKSLQQNEEHLPLVPHFTNQNSEWMLFLPLLLIAYKLIHLSIQISQHYHKT